MLTDNEYQLISQMAYAQFGIVLSAQKRSLIIGRLNKVLLENNFNSFETYYHYVRNDKSGKALSTFIDSIATNHTYFYREPDHFDFLLSRGFQDIVNQNKNRKIMHIWSSGCSSGEEAYVLAMLLNEFFGSELKDWDIGVLATDISSKMIETARKGVYSGQNAERLPDILRYKYMKRLPDGNWSVKQHIKELVLFRRLNLMSEFNFKGKFQVVFSRNVMIYFDDSVRHNLFRKYYDLTEHGGYLFIGHSETMGKANVGYSYICPAVYRKDPD